MSGLTKRSVSRLCDDGWLCKGCPEIFADDSAELAKQISITDDFGNTIAMSKDQFRFLVNQSKAGKLEI